MPMLWMLGDQDTGTPVTAVATAAAASCVGDEVDQRLQMQQVGASPAGPVQGCW